MNDADRALFERAVRMSDRAYAPYSRFHVGAAVLARDGRIFEGVNVENASYSLGVCGERTALVQAVSAGYKPGELEALAVTASPCGGCRQWLLEFGLDRIIYRNNAGEVVSTTPPELLPDSFVL